MKRILVIMCAVAMCLVLVACGQDADTGEDTADEEEYHYQAYDVAAGTDLGDFVSEDLAGNEVTDSVFEDRDVTILNVWATFCGPCLEEMPALQKLADELPDNAQVIGVVIDAPPGDGEMADEARTICKETGVTYTNLLASDSVIEMLNMVEAVPTTFILDKEGKTICTPIVGADVEAYRKAVEDYLK